MCILLGLDTKEFEMDPHHFMCFKSLKGLQNTRRSPSDKLLFIRPAKDSPLLGLHEGNISGPKSHGSSCLYKVFMYTHVFIG